MNIDPNVFNVILGVVANVLTALLAGSYQIGKRLIAPGKDDESGLKLDFILKQAQEDLSDAIEWKGPPGLEEVCLFLTSPEVESVIRQILSARLLTEEQTDLNTIKTEFSILFERRFDIEPEEARSAADRLFNGLMEVVQQGLNSAIESGILIAHEAKSSLRHRVLRDELLSIKKNLEFLVAQQHLDISAVLKFEERYRDQVRQRHSRITPPNFDDARKLPIDSIYVSPKFSERAAAFHTIYFTNSKWEDTLFRSAHIYKSADILISQTPSDSSFTPLVTMPKREDQLISLQNFLSRAYRIVVLGTPGGGKSTLTNKLCYDLTKHYSERRFANRLVTPILVVLREYGAEKKEGNCSILQFIELSSNTRYQVAPPEGAFEYLLLNGRAVVIFDGLDELLDTGYRQEIRDDIESFCNLYPSAPVIVTSREVGYEQAPLDPERFETFRLAPFGDEEVREYVQKWFTVGTELSPIQRRQKADAFLNESSIVSDLRSNPLMLGLMCNIYRGENYIPRNRPDVYRKCAEMLFDRWDRSREIPSSFHFEDDIRPAMAFLAYWIYQDEKLQEGVLERDLIRKATDYLLSHRFEDEDKAERAAREFIEFCKGRAWIFTEVGTDKDGEGIYQFTHRTFLEYFTAVYLVRTHETADKLLDTLLPRISKQEWDVVAQLAVQIKSRSSEGAADKMLTGIIETERKSTTKDNWNLLSFASRCLEFMEPNPKTVREITMAVIDRCLYEIIEDKKKEPISQKPSDILARHLFGERRTSEEVLKALFSVGGRSHTTIADTTRQELLMRIKSGNDQESLAALEIGMHLSRFLKESGSNNNQIEELQRSWTNVSSNIVDECRETIEALSSKEFPLCLDAYYRRLIPLSSFLEWYGLDSLFRATIFTISNQTRADSVAATLLQSAEDYFCSADGSNFTLTSINDLRTVGDYVLSSTLAPLQMELESYFIIAKLFAKTEENQEKRLAHLTEVDGSLTEADGSLNFGLFFIYAVILEFYDWVAKRITVQVGKDFEVSIPVSAPTSVDPPRIFSLIKRIHFFYFKYIAHILLARFETVDSKVIQEEMEKAKFNPPQQEFAWRWIKKEITFTQQVDTPDNIGLKFK